LFWKVWFPTWNKKYLYHISWLIINFFIPSIWANFSSWDIETKQSSSLGGICLICSNWIVHVLVIVNVCLIRFDWVLRLFSISRWLTFRLCKSQSVSKCFQSYFEWLTIIWQLLHCSLNVDVLFELDWWMERKCNCRCEESSHFVHLN
jgi:hypothetical protein